MGPRGNEKQKLCIFFLAGCASGLLNNSLLFFTFVQVNVHQTSSTNFFNLLTVDSYKLGIFSVLNQLIKFPFFFNYYETTKKATHKYMFIVVKKKYILTISQTECNNQYY